MTDVLRQLIEVASGASERTFMTTGSFPPTWHMITADGEHLFSGPISHDKDTQVALIRALMIIRNIVRYVFIDEAWILERKEIDRAEIDRVYQVGLKDHPDRKEILMFSAEDQSAGMMMGHRDIIRERGRKARLGPLVIDKFDQSEGRMVGLLPVVGATQ
jgi:hypothetical protein